MKQIITKKMLIKPNAPEYHFVLIYLGRRGGGEQILLESEEYLRVNYSEYTIVCSEELNSRFRLENGISFPIPRKYTEIFNLRANLKFVLRFLQLYVALQSKKSRIIFLQIMPSPTDIFFDLLAKRLKASIVRSIHDLQAHPGEKWPSAKSILKRIKKAQILIAYSNYISTGIRQITEKQILIANLPDKVYSESQSEKVEIRPIISKAIPSVCVIGRAYEYKGYELLADALSQVKLQFKFSAHGLGNYPLEFESLGIVTNRWLSNSELMSEIENADILIFPYIEASQSGIIPIARAANKIIVASAIGGLSEQLQDYERAILVEPRDSFKLKEAIEFAIKCFQNGKFLHVKAMKQDNQMSTIEITDKYFSSSKN